jgi:hypothetical protein
MFNSPVFKLAICIISAAIAGCASPSDVDVSKVDSDCAQKCSANHSTCLSAFTLFPIMQNNQCVDSLKTCVQTCPAKKELPINSLAGKPSGLDQARAKCLELGFKTGTESFGQCVLKIAQ